MNTNITIETNLEKIIGIPYLCCIYSIRVKDYRNLYQSYNKFQYDSYGDPGNTASRMESHGVPGKIQISKDTYEILKDEFALEHRGTIDVKGKGQMETWFLTSCNERTGP